MKYAIYDPATGRIDRMIRCPEQFLAANVGVGEQVLETEGAETNGTHYVNTAADAPQLVPFPPRPGPMYDWDWGSMAWVANLSAARASKVKSIEAGRETAIAAPILVAGVTLDADSVAQRNIASKLQEIAQRRALQQPMPADLLIWLDADNQLHTFDSQDALEAFLGQLTIAIAERATRAYAWSWTAKKAVADAQDAAAIQNVAETFPG